MSSFGQGRLKHRTIQERVNAGEKIPDHLIEKFRRRVLDVSVHNKNPKNRLIQYSSYAITGAVSLYMVMYHDYGYQDHCFMPIRRWYQNKLNSFWSLSSEEKQELKERGQL